jgi:hypothetical protein
MVFIVVKSLNSPKNFLFTFHQKKMEAPKKRKIESLESQKIVSLEEYVKQRGQPMNSSLKGSKVIMSQGKDGIIYGTPEKVFKLKRMRINSGYFVLEDPMTAHPPVQPKIQATKARLNLQAGNWTTRGQGGIIYQRAGSSPQDPGFQTPNAPLNQPGRIVTTQGRGGIIYRRPGPPPIPQPIQNVQQLQPSRIAHQIVGHDQKSSKMLVILDSGEQRLITYTLPRRTCTVQELLEQVDIRLDKDSDIECIANPGGQIDYIVMVGQNRNQRETDPAILTKQVENAIRQRQLAQRQVPDQASRI